MRVWGALVAVGLCSLVAAGALVPSGTGAAPRLHQLQGVNFVGACRFSHRLMDDPIVFPGRLGASHDHTFVGNTTTNAFSTLRSLRAGSTTCRRGGETAAYWMPTLLLNGQAVEPRGATIYYRRRTLDAVRPFPPGFRMIAGDSHAMAPQDLRVTFWNCGAMTGIPPSASVPTCPNERAARLRLHVNFPNCWDGRNLDSANHQSHVAYSVRGMCPASHPVAMPAVSLIFRYPVTGGAGASLASGGQYSAHGDFFNAWRQGVLASLVHDCLNSLRHCGRDR
jgi:hypothetical protein